MPRPIIGTSPQTTNPTVSAPVARQRPAKVDAKPSLRPRSRRYMDALTRLDAGHLHGKVDMDALLDEIATEFAPAGWAVPLGLQRFQPAELPPQIRLRRPGRLAPLRHRQPHRLAQGVDRARRRHARLNHPLPLQHAQDTETPARAVVA